MRHFPALILMLMLVGCAPSLPPETTQTSLLSQAETESRFILDDKWWTRYAIPELNQTVELALARNTDLAKAAIKVNRALYQAKLIGADLYPAFDASGSGGASRDISKSAHSDQNFSGSVGITYEIDLWRRLALAATAKEWEYTATIEDLESARLSLINSVVDAWFKVHYLTQAIALLETDVTRYEQLLTITKNKYEAGKVTSIEPMQAEQSLISARNKLLSARTQYSTTTQTLRDLLDLQTDESFPIADLDMADIPFVAVDLEVPVTALAARPDIAAAEARLNAMFSSLETQKREWFPKISIGSTLSVSSDSMSTFFDVPVLAGLVKVSFPFLDWNTLRWQTKISETEFEEAKLNFTSAVTRALNEVDAAYTSYSNAQRTLQNSVSKAALDKNIAAYYETRYTAGAEEFKDYINAVNTANASAVSALEAKYTALSLENTIYKAMGGRYEPR